MDAQPVVQPSDDAARATAAMNSGVAYVLASLETPASSTEVTYATHGRRAPKGGFAAMLRDFETLDVYLRWVKRDAPDVYAAVVRAVGA